jgi:hypothetical protein
MINPLSLVGVDRVRTHPMKETKGKLEIGVAKAALFVEC